MSYKASVATEKSLRFWPHVHAILFILLILSNIRFRVKERQSLHGRDGHAPFIRASTLTVLGVPLSEA
jgi:hypothetical protein